eukprot:30918-Pelagococcus_subviridis.AAC.18
MDLSTKLTTFAAVRGVRISFSVFETQSSTAEPTKKSNVCLATVTIMEQRLEQTEQRAVHEHPRRGVDDAGVLSSVLSTAPPARGRDLVLLVNRGLRAFEDWVRGSRQLPSAVRQRADGDAAAVPLGARAVRDVVDARVRYPPRVFVLLFPALEDILHGLRQRLGHRGDGVLLLLAVLDVVRAEKLADFLGDAQDIVREYGREVRVQQSSSTFHERAVQRVQQVALLRELRQRDVPRRSRLGQTLVQRLEVPKPSSDGPVLSVLADPADADRVHRVRGAAFADDVHLGYLRAQGLAAAAAAAVVAAVAVVVAAAARRRVSRAGRDRPRCPLPLRLVVADHPRELVRFAVVVLLFADVRRERG